jgi:dihydropyrimidinase
MKPYDLIIRGGTVATASQTFKADVAIRGEAIAAVGRGLGPARREIDAAGRVVVPGGVDSHTHIEQLTAAGIMNADSFETATRAAVQGGTTSVISFAAQHVGMSLAKVVDDYAALARRGAVIDHAFHLLLADPTPDVLTREVPQLVRAGHTSLKVFMTYDRLRLDDEKLLDVLQAAKDNGALVMAHCENHGMIRWMADRLVAQGQTAPKFHAAAHMRASEPEAINRFITLARHVGQKVMIFHVSTAEGAALVRQARGEGADVEAETCPQYLFLTGKDLDRPGNEGARFVFSPPPRERADQEALWRALALGDLQTVSSDHAPFAFDQTGKLRNSLTPTFKQIPSGLPGLATRLPLLFDAVVSKKRFGLPEFVRWSATEPARIYGLTTKGVIAPGYDADIAIWDPKRRVTLADGPIHGLAGYTPFAGRTVTGWPETVLSRGRVILEGGEVTAQAGSGQLLLRKAG